MPHETTPRNPTANLADHSLPFARQDGSFDPFVFADGFERLGETRPEALALGSAIAAALFLNNPRALNQERVAEHRHAPQHSGIYLADGQVDWDRFDALKDKYWADGVLTLPKLNRMLATETGFGAASFGEWTFLMVTAVRAHPDRASDPYITADEMVQLYNGSLLEDWSAIIEARVVREPLSVWWGAKWAVGMAEVQSGWRGLLPEASDHDRDAQVCWASTPQAP